MDINNEYTGYFNKSLTSFSRYEPYHCRAYAFASFNNLSSIDMANSEYDSTTFNERCFEKSPNIKSVRLKGFLDLYTPESLDGSLILYNTVSSVSSCFPVFVHYGDSEVRRNDILLTFPALTTSTEIAGKQFIYNKFKRPVEISMMYEGQTATETGSFTFGKLSSKKFTSGSMPSFVNIFYFPRTIDGDMFVGGYSNSVYTSSSTTNLTLTGLPQETFVMSFEITTNIGGMFSLSTNSTFRDELNRVTQVMIPNDKSMFYYSGIDESLKYGISDYCFSNCGNLLTVECFDEIPEFDYIGSYAFFNCSSLSYFECNCNDTIKTHAFDGCYSLNEFNTNASSIQDYAFYNCSSMETFTSNNIYNILTIGKYAFSNASLKNDFILLRNNCSFGDYAFYNSKFAGFNIHSHTEPYSINVSKIGSYAFANCSSLQPPNGTTFSFCQNNPSSTVSVGIYAFANSNIEKLEIGSASSSLGDDKTALSIGNYIVSGCTDLNSILINPGYYDSSATEFPHLTSTLSPYSFKGVGEKMTIDYDAVYSMTAVDYNNNDYYNILRKLKGIILINSTNAKSLSSSSYFPYGASKSAFIFNFDTTKVEGTAPNIKIPVLDGATKTTKYINVVVES